MSSSVQHRATTADYWNGPEDRGTATAKMVKPPPRFGHVAVGLNVQYGENLQVRECTILHILIYQLASFGARSICNAE